MDYLHKKCYSTFNLIVSFYSAGSFNSLDWTQSLPSVEKRKKIKLNYISFLFSLKDQFLALLKSAAVAQKVAEAQVFCSICQIHNIY